MRNKLLTKPTNRLLIARNRYLALGGTKNALIADANNMNKIGDFTSSLGSAVGAINPIAGLAVTAGGQIFKGLFGSDINQQNVEAFNTQNETQANRTFNASTTDDLLAQSDFGVLSMIDKSDVGSDGIFSNRASKLTSELNADRVKANNRAYGNFAVAANNLNTLNGLNALTNSFAYGGSTHGADFTNGMTFINNGGSHESNPYEGVPIGVDPEGNLNLVEEGETIFNDYVFSKRLKVPKSIRNKYKLGGPISFTDASKKLAKESEERPNDPISKRGLIALMSDLAMSQEELKATKQEGLFAYGGKVNKFDGESTPTQQINRARNKYKGVSGYNDNWVDDNGNYIQSYVDMVNARNDAGWNQHFNDQYNYYMNPANKGSLRWQAIDNFYAANPDFKVANIELTPDEIEWARNGAKTGPIGFMHTWDQTAPTSQTAAPALTLTDDPYSWINDLASKRPDVFTDSPIPTQTLNPTDRIKRNWVRIKQADGTYGEAMTMDDAMSQGLLKNHRRVSQDDKYGDYGDEVLGYYDPFEEQKAGKYQDWLRYAPAVGLGLSAITDSLGWTNKPDYSNADAILEATNGAGTYQPVRFNPIGNYLSYNPFDRDYYINKLNAEAGATRRAALQTAGVNRGAGMAALLAADNNAQNQLGNLARQAAEYNLAQRQQVEDFNRTTNITNSQGMLQADTANQKALAEQREFNLKGTLAAAQMREAARQAADTNKANNISGLFASLANIGFEEANKRMADKVITSIGIPGGEKFGSRISKNGGKIKRRKGLTF